MFISTFCRASVIHHKGLDGLKLGIRMIFVQALICGNVLDLIQTDGIRKDSVWYPLLNQRSCKLSKSKWFLFSVSVYPSLIDPAAPSTPSTHFFCPKYLIALPSSNLGRKENGEREKQKVMAKMRCWSVEVLPAFALQLQLLRWFIQGRRSPRSSFLFFHTFFVHSFVSFFCTFNLSHFQTSSAHLGQNLNI